MIFSSFSFLLQTSDTHPHTPPVPLKQPFLDQSGLQQEREGEEAPLCRPKSVLLAEFYHGIQANEQMVVMGILVQLL